MKGYTISGNWSHLGPKLNFVLESEMDHQEVMEDLGKMFPVAGHCSVAEEDLTLNWEITPQRIYLGNGPVLCCDIKVEFYGSRVEPVQVKVVWKDDETLVEGWISRDQRLSRILYDEEGQPDFTKRTPGLRLELI